MKTLKLQTKCQSNVNDVVLVSSLLTWHIMSHPLQCLYGYFEQVNVFSGFARNYNANYIVYVNIYSITFFTFVCWFQFCLRKYFHWLMWDKFQPGLSICRITALRSGHLPVQSQKQQHQNKFEICSKLTIKTPERRHWRCSGIFIVNIEHISHHVLVFLLLT